MIVQPETTRWRLDTLLTAPEGAPVEALVNELEQTTKTLEALRPHLTDDLSPQQFSAMLKNLEHFVTLGNRMMAYGQLWFTEDTQNQAALGYMGRMDQLLTDAYNRILFIDLWWKAVDVTVSERLLPHAGQLTYYLQKMRLYQAHTLAESEEKIINLKNLNGTNALTTLYDMITNKFVFTLEVEGEMKKMTRGELMAYVYSPKPEIRAAAYQEQLRVYEAESAVLAQIYIHRVRDWSSENVTLRHYASPMAVRNLDNDVPDTVIETLLDVCAEQAPVFQRYFKLKAKLLGVEQLRRYDMYASLQQRDETAIPYQQAIDIVMDSFHQFSPQVAAQAERVFHDQHIDSQVRPGKRGGAFCYSVLPELTPWVMLNYEGKARDVATMAHELGHAVHGMLAADHSVLTFHSALPMAETASVFSEMLLTDRLLNETNDPAIRRQLLVEAINDAYATVMRQAYFVRFERAAHQAIAEGKTMHELNSIYQANLTEQFGDSLDVSDDFQYEWIAIPHIYHTPFYCYAYSFGQLLSLSLYQQYKNEGATFAPKFLKILAYGGSAKPHHILTEAGINIADPDFWRGGFKVVEGMIEELANL